MGNMFIVKKQQEQIRPHRGRTKIIDCFYTHLNPSDSFLQLRNLLK
jgi:hypothetical protein